MDTIATNLAKELTLTTKPLGKYLNAIKKSIVKKEKKNKNNNVKNKEKGRNKLNFKKKDRLSYNSYNFRKDCLEIRNKRLKAQFPLQKQYPRWTNKIN
jgi:chorismate-pyruvate lyase